MVMHDRALYTQWRITVFHDSASQRTEFRSNINLSLHFMYTCLSIGRLHSAYRSFAQPTIWTMRVLVLVLVLVLVFVFA